MNKINIMEPEVEKIIKLEWGNPKVEFLGEGKHNKAFLINDSEVLRLSKTKHSQRKMLMYIEELSEYREKLPVNTPLLQNLTPINSESYVAYAKYQYLARLNCNLNY